MECFNCGRLNNKDASFCSYCRSSLSLCSARTENNSISYQVESDFLSGCRICGKNIDPAGDFCKYCGAEQRSPSSPGSTVDDFVITTDKSNKKYSASSDKEVDLIEKEKIRRVLPKKVTSPIYKTSRSAASDNNIPEYLKLGEELNIEDVRIAFKNILAVDMGPFYIKLLKMDLDEESFLYPDFISEVKTPPGVFKGNVLANIKPALSLIRNIVEKEGIKFKSLSTLLPSFLSFVRILKIPRLEESNIAKIIKDELETFLPFPLKKTRIDAWILPERNSEDDDFIEVKVHAVHKASVNNLLLLSELAGGGAENIISGHRAHFNALRFVSSDKPDKIAIVEMGYHNTNITIVKRGRVVQTNSIKKGFYGLIRAVANGKRVSSDKAIELIRKYKVDITRADKKSSEFFHIVLPVIRDWITELLKGFAVFGGAFKVNRKNFSSLILCGDGAEINNLDNFIGNQLGVSCYKFRLPAKPSGEEQDKSEFHSSFMGCMGLVAESFYEEEEYGEKVEIKTDFWSSIFGS